MNNKFTIITLYLAIDSSSPIELPMVLNSSKNCLIAALKRL